MLVRPLPRTNPGLVAVGTVLIFTPIGFHSWSVPLFLEQVVVILG